MAINWEQISKNIVNISEVLADFLDTTNEKTVTWVYMNDDGSITEMEVPNLATAINTISENAISEDEFNETIANYYDKAGVDAIKDDIMAVFDNYYVKGDVDTKVNDAISKAESDLATESTNLQNDYNSKIDNAVSKAESDLSAESTKLQEDYTSKVNLTKVMTKAEKDAVREANRQMYAGSGFVDFGGAYTGWATPEINNGLAIVPLTSTIQGNVLYMGTSDNVPVVNVSGDILLLENYEKSFSTNIKNIIKLPEPATIKTVITDSTNLGSSLKQGDFALLKDLDRELVSNGTFDENIDGWLAYNDATLDYDSENKTLKIINNVEGSYGIGRIDVPAISNIKYIVRIDVAELSGLFKLKFRDLNSRDNIIDGIIDEAGYFEFEVNATTYGTGGCHVDIQCFSLGEGDYIVLNSVSVKQAEETPIVAFLDVEAGIDVYENTLDFEARDSVSRQDLIFLEKWQEELIEKDIFYPFGNVQYRGNDVDGLTGIAEGTFEGADTYSLFGNWQEPGALIGKGYVWSSLTDEQKTILANNKDHNIEIDGEGKWLQTRYRMRVVKGLGNNWENVDPTIDRMFAFNNDYGKYGRVVVKAKQLVPYYGYDLYSTDYNTYKDRSMDENYGYIGTFVEQYGNNDSAEALPIALVQRRNDGVFNKIFNPLGTAIGYDSDNNAELKIEEYALTDAYFKSLEDCFKLENIAAVTADGNVVPADDSSAENRTGYILSGKSGHETELYADEVNELDVNDLRLDAKKYDLQKLLEDTKLEAIRAKIRGKENIDYSRSIINQPVLFSADTAATDNYEGYSLYIGSGVDDYELKDNGKLVYSKPGKVISLFDGKNYIRLLVKENGYRLRRLSFDHELTGNYGMPWISGDVVNMSIFFNETLSGEFNNTFIQTDIIGDPRTLEERMEYVTVNGDDQTAVIRENTYVKANDNYYRSLVDRGDDAITIDPDTENYSDSDNWLDLGDDGSIGGYNKAWRENKFNATSLIVKEDGSDLLPINAPKVTSWNYGISIEYNTSEPSLRVRLSKKLVLLKKVLVSKKDGTFVPYIIGPSSSENLSANSGGTSLYYNSVFLNLSYSDLGYDSVDEMLDLMTVIVIYNGKSNFMTPIASSPVLVRDDRVRFYIKESSVMGALINQCLINKIPTGLWNGDWDRTFTHFAIDVNSGTVAAYNGDYSYVPEHNSFELPSNVFNPVKAFSYFTTVNDRLVMVYVFKELKLGDDWGDDNKLVPYDYVNSTTDLNGNYVIFGQKGITLNKFYIEG